MAMRNGPAHGLIILLAGAIGALLATWMPRLMSPPVPPPAASNNSPPAGASSEAAPYDDFPWPADTPTPEQVLYAQPRMMRRALSGLGPRVPGRPNIYLLAFAGDGSEDVFRNEAEYAARLFAQRFGASTHSLVLENNPASLATHPLASWSNLESALDGIHEAMDPAQDILLVYLTTHGSEDHALLVDMDPLPLDQIDADDLAGILSLRPFKWKVVVVNACYSGGFVPPLRGPGTLVLTAARADRSSFGCGSDSDATYFGKAWLVDALNRTDNFIAAFHQARNEIAEWETRDDLTPSEPQIDVGHGIEDQLAAWRRGLAAGPAVPFKPEVSRKTRSE